MRSRIHPLQNYWKFQFGLTNQGLCVVSYFLVARIFVARIPWLDIAGLILCTRNIVTRRFPNLCCSMCVCYYLRAVWTLSSIEPGSEFLLIDHGQRRSAKLHTTQNNRPTGFVLPRSAGPACLEDETDWRQGTMSRWLIVFGHEWMIFFKSWTYTSRFLRQIKAHTQQLHSKHDDDLPRWKIQIVEMFFGWLRKHISCAYFMCKHISCAGHGGTDPSKVSVTAVGAPHPLFQVFFVSDQSDQTCDSCTHSNMLILQGQNFHAMYVLFSRSTHSRTTVTHSYAQKLQCVRDKIIETNHPHDIIWRQAWLSPFKTSLRRISTVVHVMLLTQLGPLLLQQHAMPRTLLRGQLQQSHHKSICSVMPSAGWRLLRDLHSRRTSTTVSRDFWPSHTHTHTHTHICILIQPCHMRRYVRAHTYS